MLVVDQRDHDLEVRRPAGALAHRLGGAHDRLDLHLVDLGVEDPEPARRACRASGSPRRSASTRVEQCARARRRSSVHSIRARSTSRCELVAACGRNSCSGGSSSRIVTGRPSIASKSPSKSSCWSGSSSPSARAALLVVVGHDHRPHLRLAVLGHEHVLGAAQADALGAEARAPARRPPACRRSRARRGGGARRPTRAPCSKFSLTSGSTSGTSSTVTSPRRAVDRDPVALPQHGAADADRPRARGRSSSVARRRPRTGRPMPRATSAACEALPPSLVRIPLAAWKPATSSASVNGRTRITSRPSLRRPRPRPAAVNTISPLAAPGDAATPRASTSYSALGSNVGCSSASSVSASIVASASLLGRAAPRRRRRPRSAPRPAPGAWRCASGACRAAPPRP